MVDTTLLIYTLNNKISNDLAPFLKEKNISYSEGQILLFIKQGHGSKQDYLASRLNMKKSFISQSIKKLNEKGLVYVKQDIKDKRTNNLTLTKTGEQVVKEFDVLIRDYNEKMTSKLNDYNKINIEYLIREMFFSLK